MKRFARKYNGASLYFAVFNPGSNDFWLYNINDIDFRKINRGVFKDNKVTQYDPKSDKKDEVIYQIPFELATHCEIYPNADVKQAEEEKTDTQPLF